MASGISLKSKVVLTELKKQKSFQLLILYANPKPLKMRTKFWGLPVIISLIVIACKTNQSGNISTTNIKEIVKSSDVTLVDVRIPEQYTAGTAKNAINIPLGELQNNIETLKGKKVVVFCNKGIQADQAMEILKKNGVEAYDGTTWKNVKAIQDEGVKK
ncbi:rhodanese-like domain-containing protein [Chryseobacterium indologenes]|nr:rhodanese-like domain-containing protein [Chryseobacterium indologenes]AYY84209.1 rhodanese-like domain-containing protein [Chryseobacterium indologenes]TLX25770.1 rhodanese-like domain-containing protein [Chryseobacterium indologenes]HAO27305.1 rhodanese-like domain-containing protein [Chryseobacterium indologenes]